MATEVARVGNGSCNRFVNKNGNGSGEGCDKKVATEEVMECFGTYMNKQYKHILI